MDFHTLARRELQALCKKNQIPANSTNVAMAYALASLPQVEGLKEFLCSTEDDVTQSLRKENPSAQVISRSMTRASTRRRTALKPESEQFPSCTTARRSMRNRIAAAADQESKVLNFPETPAFSRTKKKAEAASVQPKVEKEEEGEMINEGDAVAERTAVNTTAKTRQGKTQASVTQTTRVYTRRSTRLLEKSMKDLKLCDEVVRDLEHIKMGDLAAEKELTEEPEDAIKEDHAPESAQTIVEENPEENNGEMTLPLAEVFSYEVEKPVEAENQIEAEEESKSSEICCKSEAQIAESEVDAPVEVDTLAEDLSDLGQINIDSEAVIHEVEVMIGLGNEMGTDKESRSTESMTQDSQEIVNDKSDELDELADGAPGEGLTSVEEAAAIADGNNVSELTVQVATLNLDCQKDINEDMDSQVIITAAVHDVSACFMEESKVGYYEDDNVISYGYLAENDGGKNGDGISDKLDIHDAPVLEKPNNAVSDLTEEMESSHNAGQLHGFDVTEAEEFVGTVDERVIVNNVDLEVQNDEIRVGAGCSEAEPWEDIFHKKTPASEDTNKENRGDGPEVRIENITDILFTEDDNQKQPIPLKKKSFGKLKKMLWEKTKIQNEKRHALQTLPENHHMAAVVGEKDDCRQ